MTTQAKTHNQADRPAARVSARLVIALMFTFGAACAASSDGAGTGGGNPWGGSGGTGGTGGTGAIGGFGATGGTGGTGAIGGFGATGGTGGTGAIGGDAGTGGEPRQPLIIEDCQPSAVLTAENIQALQAGGSGSGMRFVYPYEGTVFPRGTKSPLLMWEGPSTVAVYLHIQSSLFDYKGCLVPAEDLRVTIPQDVWEAAGRQTLGANDPFTISMTTFNADVVSGPISREIVIAQATLKGSIFYNSYSSGLAPNGGAVLRIPPGGVAELFVGSTKCIGCHSVSANGARLIADSEEVGVDPLPPPFIGGFGFGGGAGGSVADTGPSVFAITPTTQAEPTPLREPARYVAFAGLSPDGSVYIANAPGVVTSVSTTPPTALLIETDTGIEIANSNVQLNASMPSFAPDGQSAVFIDAMGLEAALNGLMVADFDPTQRRFGDARPVIDHTNIYMGWPFVLPDNQAVVYTRSTTDSSYSGTGSGFYAGLTMLELMEPSARTELYVVDLKTKRQVRLDAAMGYDAVSSTTDATYLPFGPTELGRAYYPTVSPVAAGGYFWVFFDSVRYYGNYGPQRQLWGTAVSISPDGSYDTDPSHPAFYLPGQELGTGNHRAFTALDPCRNDGTSCDTGIDCCSGFCTNGSCVTPPVDRCSATSEACDDNADCCDTTERCFAGFCSELGPD